MQDLLGCGSAALSSKEVAARTGRTDAAVRKLYSRALGRLREIMADDTP